MEVPNGETGAGASAASRMPLSRPRCSPVRDPIKPRLGARLRPWHTGAMDTRQPASCRKRLKRWEIDGQSRFVTFSCERRLPLLRNPAIADLTVTALAKMRSEHALSIFAWVVMPEHVHLLVRPASGGEVEHALRSLKTSVARQTLARWRELEAPILNRLGPDGRAPRFWLKGGGFDRNIRDAGEFRRTVQYIHRNPVERGLVEEPEQWRWSSVSWWNGLREVACPCDPPPGDPRAWEEWKGYR